MIRAVIKKAIPYVLEDDRNSPITEQTVFWVTPKRSHEANKTLQRYGGAQKDGRGGYREFNVNKLDAADVEEFISLVEKVERYCLAPDTPFIKQFKGGIVIETTDKAVLAEIAASMSSGQLTEIFDASGDASKLEAGKYLGFKEVNIQE